MKHIRISKTTIRVIMVSVLTIVASSCGCPAQIGQLSTGTYGFIMALSGFFIARKKTLGWKMIRENAFDL